MHYTISKTQIAELLDDARHNRGDWLAALETTTYIPSHDIGEGWTRQLVQLDEGDTADNPASTKGPIYGPAFVVYDRHPSGTTVHVYETPADFYNKMRAVELLKRAYDSGQLRDTAVGLDIGCFLLNSGAIEETTA